MSSDLNPSSQGASPSQPINPYQSSRTPALAEDGRIPESDSQRHWSSRLDWYDRRTLLKSVAPTRISVIAHVVIWGQSLFQYLSGLGRIAKSDQFDWSDVAAIIIVGLGFLFILHSILGIYCCWLGWQYADRLQALAGGRTKSFGAWCDIHYRWEWFSAWSAALGLAIAAFNWFSARGAI